MRQAAQNLRFPQELFLQLLRAESVAEGFQGYGAVDERVVGFVNAAGGANADGAQNFIASLRHRVFGDGSLGPAQYQKLARSTEWAGRHKLRRTEVPGNFDSSGMLFDNRSLNLRTVTPRAGKSGSRRRTPRASRSEVCVRRNAVAAKRGHATLLVQLQLFSAPPR